MEDGNYLLPRGEYAVSFPDIVGNVVLYKRSEAGFGTN